MQIIQSIKGALIILVLVILALIGYKACYQKELKNIKPDGLIVFNPHFPDGSQRPIE